MNPDEKRENSENGRKETKNFLISIVTITAVFLLFFLAKVDYIKEIPY